MQDATVAFAVRPNPNFLEVVEVNADDFRVDDMEAPEVSGYSFCPWLALH